MQPFQSSMWHVSGLPMLVQAGAGLPPGMDGRGWCPACASISLMRASWKSLCEIPSHHMKIKGHNCWEWPGPTGGKRAFLSTYMFDGWLCRYCPSYLHCQHAPCDSYNLPQPLALSHSQVHHNNCLLWVDCECLSGGTRPSCPSTPKLSQPRSLLNCHHVSISVFWVRDP